MTFDEAPGALLAMVGQRVEVHVLDASDSPTSSPPLAVHHWLQPVSG